MFNLQIFDVSSFVHIGATSTYYGDRSYYGYPVGGIHYLMRSVLIAMLQYDDVILAFDSKHNKKKLIPGFSYKANRELNHAAVSQIGILYDNLSACNFSCIRVNGYEADDIINWCVTDGLADNYEAIVIYGNDKDLAHNVQERVFFKPINKKGNVINYNNFSAAIEKGESIFFNTISAYKVFCGCQSDHVPPFTSENGMEGTVLYNLFVSLFQQEKLPRGYKYTSSKTVLENVIKQLPAVTNGTITAKDVENLLTRCTIIFPAERTDDYTFMATKFNQIDKEKLRNFLTMYNDRDSLSFLGWKTYPLKESEKEYVKTLAYNLSTGAYAVDNNFEVNKQSIPSGETLFLKEF